MSTRRKYRITPDEEDATCDHVEELVRGIFNLRVKENVADMVGGILGRELMKGDKLHFNYNIDMDVQTLEGILGKIRKATIDFPTPPKVKRNHKKKR